MFREGWQSKNHRNSPNSWILILLITSKSIGIRSKLSTAKSIEDTFLATVSLKPTKKHELLIYIIY